MVSRRSPAVSRGSAGGLVSRESPCSLQEVSMQSPGFFHVFSMRSPGSLQGVSRQSPGGLQVVSKQIPCGLHAVSRWDSGGLQAVSKWSPGGLHAVIKQFVTDCPRDQLVASRQFPFKANVSQENQVLCHVLGQLSTVLL